MQYDSNSNTNRRSVNLLKTSHKSKYDHQHCTTELHQYFCSQLFQQLPVVVEMNTKKSFNNLTRKKQKTKKEDHKKSRKNQNKISPKQEIS